jgi:exonuclease III
MKIISWNIRGLNNPHKHDILKNMIRDNRLDIFVIQETKMLKDKVECLPIFKGRRIISNYYEGASGGMVFFWINRWIQGELISQNRNMMNVRFFNSKDDFSWVLTNFYVPNSKWGRKAMWEEISN